MKLGENWRELGKYFHKFDAVIGVLLLAAALWFVWITGRIGSAPSPRKRRCLQRHSLHPQLPLGKHHPLKMVPYELSTESPRNHATPSSRLAVVTIAVPLATYASQLPPDPSVRRGVLTKRNGATPTNF